MGLALASEAGPSRFLQHIPPQSHQGLDAKPFSLLNGLKTFRVSAWAFCGFCLLRFLGISWV